MTTTSWTVAVLGASLLGPRAVGEYLGLASRVVAEPVIEGIPAEVWRVYAMVGSPLDTVEVISGNAASPVLIQVSDGCFYQHTGFGDNDIEPNPVLVDLDPDLRFDTYVTIGAHERWKAPTSLLEFGFTGCAVLWLNNGAWYRTPGHPLTEAGTCLGNRVLVAQFTIEADSDVAGQVRVAGRFDGVSEQFDDEQFTAGAPFFPYRCPADVDFNGLVDIDDLIAVIVGWGAVEGPCPQPADIDFDGFVGVDDLIGVIADWAQWPCPDPSLGACDFPGPGCIHVTADQCAAQGGSWHGLGSLCQPP